MTRPLPPAAVPAARPHLRAALVAAGTAAVAAALVLAPEVLSTQAVSSNPLRANQAMPYVAAHRGDAETGPENTLAAFRGAVAAGTDVLEADVRLTADRIPVLMHDATVDRTTDGTGALADLAFAQVRELDAGSWLAPEFAGERVPLFDELLNYLLLDAVDLRALVELKGDWPVDDTRLLVSAVRARGLVDRVVFASFSPESLAALLESGPEIPRAMLFAELPDDPVEASADVEPIAIMTRLASLRERPELVEQIHGAGLGLLVYTLNTGPDWAEAVRLGVDGIITDQPGGLGSWMPGSDAQAVSSSAR